ncbi:MAG: methylated-DNA--[protein]-cysteine S-methyltransferase, partial [Limnothrix sp.]
LQTEWKNAIIHRDNSKIKLVGDRLFDHDPIDTGAFSLHLKGTAFQLQVWRELLNIPFAQTTTYQAIANAIGKPTSSRAVGNAVGRNPVSFLIPCHRVIRSSGAMGGYRWGLDRKVAMLDWESKQVTETDKAKKQLITN